MNYNEFLHHAKPALGVETQEEVLNISRAFLHTLTDHMAGNAADNLGAQLPAELKDIIREIGPDERGQGERFKLTEFYERVADRAGVDAEQGKRYTHQFMHLLGKMITAGEVNKLMLTLSDDYAPLFEGVEGVENAPQR